MSLFGKDDQKRLTDTLEFIKGIQDIEGDSLAAFVAKNTGNIQLSRKISLGFRLVIDKAETERRRALRALLLCVGTCNDAVIDAAKTRFQGSNMETLIDGIKSYFPLAASDEQSVIKTVTQGAFVPKIGHEKHVSIDFYKYTRQALANNAKDIVGYGNCYGGATLFLYLAGIVSLRWMQTWGKQNGTMPMEPFEFGRSIAGPLIAERIPPGRLLYFFRPPIGVHYAISIRNGYCVGHNNSAFAPQDWPDAHEHAPTQNCETFKIASYLRALQFGLVAQNRPATDAYVREASCIPREGFRF